MDSVALREWLDERLAPETCVELAENAYLFRRNQPVRHLNLVETGDCQLERTTADGHTLPLARLGTDQVVAEGSLFNEHYGCDCRAITRSRVRRYPRQAVLALLRSEPALAQAFLRALAHQVMELRTRLELRNVKSARERVALHLALHADRQGRYPVTGTYKMLAQNLGLSHEALYRTLARMESDGEIRREPNLIRIVRAGGG